MKKHTIVILIFLITVISGCGNKNSNSLFKKIDFNQAIGVYSIDLEHSKDKVPSILLVGNTYDLKKNNFNDLSSQNTSVTILNDKNEAIKFSAENVDWQIYDPILLEDGFSLRLSSNKLADLKEPIFNKVTIENKDQKDDKRNISPIYIQFYSGKQNGLSVMESPFAPKNKIEIGKEYSFGYKILDSNHIMTHDIRSEIIYPDEAKKFIEIINVNIYRDENTEDQLKEEYKGKVDENKLKNIAVYELRCTYIIKEQGKIVFQPEIKLFFDQKEQSLAPLEPICFFNFEESQ
ncbi:hypothetical protein MHI24_04060 [Paenibacillus sp. FSL K6-1096]|uniref:hypothetical protein n=1 Tax=Paenibacillus sp. FSL K6-1096 TaxID=2921460 RepID=UPI0030EC6149